MIRTENIDFLYEDGTSALKNISIDFNKGKVIGIIGANGSGKSTLFLNILGLLKPAKGKVLFEEKEIKYDKKSLREYRKKVTMVFQDPDKQLFFSSVYDDIAFPLRNLGFIEEEIKIKVHAALRAVKAFDLKNKPTHFLSFGQKKRIAIAGSLVMDTNVLLLDEPTSGLDPSMSKEIKNIINKLGDEKKIVVSSHDMDFIYEICDYIYIISKGEILGEGNIEDIFLDKDLIIKADLEIPWLVKLHQNLNIPLFRNEEELLKYKS